MLPSFSLLTRGLVRYDIVKRWFYYYKPQCIFYTVSMLHSNFTTRAPVIQSLVPQQNPTLHLCLCVCVRAHACACMRMSWKIRGWNHISNVFTNQPPWNLCTSKLNMMSPGQHIQNYWELLYDICSSLCMCACFPQYAELLHICFCAEHK